VLAKSTKLGHGTKLERTLCYPRREADGAAQRRVSEPAKGKEGVVAGSPKVVAAAG